MAQKAHLVAVARSDSDRERPAAADISEVDDSAQSPTPAPHHESSTVSKKFMAILIVICLVVASGALVWALYLRHWTVDDLMRQVIDDPSPSSPGFKHSLAGRTVTVEGKLTNITTGATNKGILNILQLDENPYIELMSWGGSFSTGQRVVMDVHFEWSECNGERHVYSPQIGFPGLQYLLAIGTVLDSVSYVNSNAVISWDDFGQSVKVDIDWIREPVNMAAANATVTAGRSSWAAEYVDVLGWYQQTEPQDFLPVLTANSSEKGNIRFTDSNGDRYLDDGDSFEISGLTCPAEDSGARTYIFRCQWPNDLNPTGEYGSQFLAYLIMTNKGVVCGHLGPEGQPSTPAVQLFTSVEGGGKRVDIGKIFSTEPIPWSDIRIYLSTSTYQYATLTIDEGDLAGAAPMTKTLYGLEVLNGNASCSVTDLGGNDRMDEGDFFTISSDQDTLPDETVIDLALLHAASGVQMGTAHIQIGEQPFSNVTVTRIQQGAYLEFRIMMHNESYSRFYEPMDVAWSEIVVRLTEGLNSTLLAPPTAPGFPNMGGSGGSLGDLDVSCYYNDLQGNGFVNRGDALGLVVGSGSDFSAQKTYSVAVIYAITGVPICEASFTG